MKWCWGPRQWFVPFARSDEVSCSFFCIAARCLKGIHIICIEDPTRLGTLIFLLLVVVPFEILKLDMYMLQYHNASHMEYIKDAAVSVCLAAETSHGASHKPPRHQRDVGFHIDGSSPASV